MYRTSAEKAVALRYNGHGMMIGIVQKIHNHSFPRVILRSMESLAFSYIRTIMMVRRWKMSPEPGPGIRSTLRILSSFQLPAIAKVILAPVMIA